MSNISTHILDTSRGRPAADVPVVLELKTDQGFRTVGQGRTDKDGRIGRLVPGEEVPAGTYRISFDVAAYAASLGQKAFFPEVQIQFVVERPQEHFHIPLLYSGYGFATYRGS